MRATRVGFGGLLAVVLVATLSPVGVGQAAVPAATSLQVSDPAVSAVPGNFLSEFPDGTPPDEMPQAVSWGHNEFGELGDGTFSARYGAVRVHGGNILLNREVSVVDAGEFSSCLISEGKVYCMGFNSDGQLGSGGLQTSSIPKAVIGAIATKNASQVAVGRSHACALAAFKVYCWGGNSLGQVGNGNFTTQTSSVEVKGLLQGKKVSAIAVGRFHSCAIAEAKLYCWGYNFDGQLGNGLKTNSNVPVAVKTDGLLAGKPIAAVALGGRHTCALSLGKVYCWGNNSAGQLGNGTNTSSIAAVAVKETGTFVNAIVKSIAAGGDSTCSIAGISIGRSLYCWGDGDHGQLGKIPAEDTNLPQLSIPLINTINSISMGSSGGCMVLDGNGYCWGDVNARGRLGNNQNPPQYSANPVLIATTTALTGKTLLGISTDFNQSLAIAIKKPTFSDVPAEHTFYHDITWLAGTGTTTGYDDGKYKPGQPISRQAMALFLYRIRNAGQPNPVCMQSQDRKFVDVPLSSPFCGAIEWMVNQGITTVPGDNRFHPTNSTKRDTMATWTYRFTHPGTASQPCAGNLFTDIKAGSANCGDIEWLAKTAITTGYADGTYKRDGVISRASMAAFLHRLNGLDSH